MSKILPIILGGRHNNNVLCKLVGGLQKYQKSSEKSLRPPGILGKILYHPAAMAVRHELVHEWGVPCTASAAFSLCEGNRVPRVAVQSLGQETLTDHREVHFPPAG